MADLSLLLFASEAAVHAKPKALGMDATMWVSLAMLALIGIFVWKKVPALVTRSLDDKISAIRTQLDEASRLRSEAEALLAEYEARMAKLEADAADIKAQAEADAQALIAKAQSDSAALIKRREAMAEQRIGAAETAAITGLRAHAVDMATQLAGRVISERHDSKSDAKLVDEAIASLN